MTRPTPRDVKVTVKQVRERTSLSRSAAYELMHSLGAVKIGRSIRLPSSVFERYLARLTASSAMRVLAHTASVVVEAAATPDDAAPATVTHSQNVIEPPPTTSKSNAQALLVHALRRGRRLRAARQSQGASRSDRS